MAKNPSDPAWKREDDARITLSGSWSLLVDRQRRGRLFREFGKLDSPRDYRWNLLEVDALDSTGALVLWKVWDGQLPNRLDCSEDQRHLFKRLADMAPVGDAAGGAENWLERLGGDIATILKTGGGMLTLVGQLMLDVGYCVSHPRVIPWKEISANVYHIGATSLLLLGTIGFLIGAVMTIQLGLAMRAFGAAGLVTGAMATAVPRELGAIVVGILMAGRSGSAMTASIGAMHITEEYDALQALGSSPSLRLTLPRVIGAAIAMPLLVVWADCTAMLGSAFAAQAGLGINFRLFLVQSLPQVQIVNFWIGIGKGVLFGLVIALVGSYFGMVSSPDTESLSRNTTVSVVMSLTLVLLIDFSLGAALTNVGLTGTG